MQIGKIIAGDQSNLERIINRLNQQVKQFVAGSYQPLDAQLTDIAGLTPAAGKVIIGNGSNFVASTPVYPNAVATAGKILRSDGSTGFAASTSTFADTYEISTLLYASSANVVAGLATANSGVLITGGTGIPSIATDIPTAVTIGTKYIYRADGTDVPVADGGTGASTAADARTNLGLGTIATYAGDQNLQQANSPAFAGLTLTAFSGYVKAAAGVLSAGSIADGDLPSALTGKTYNVLTLTALATGFSIAGGTTSKTLTADETTSLSAKANLASPTFTGTVTVPTPFTIGAVSMTATAAELNILDGVTATMTQLNYLNAATGTTGTTTTNLVFSTSPTLVTPVLGAATGTSLAIDTSTLVANATGYEDKVGIGTATPATRLDITGTMRSTGMTTPTSGTGLEFFYYGSTGYFICVDRTLATLHPFEINASYIGLMTGNVGVGLAAAPKKLTVVGDGLFYGTIYAAAFTPLGESLQIIGAVYSTEALLVLKAYSDWTVTKTGTGSLKVTNKPTQADDTDYKIEIDGAGNELTATFKWSDDGGATWDETGVPVSYFYDINNGISLLFGTGTYVAGDNWTFTALGIDNQLGVFQVDTLNERILTSGEIYCAGDIYGSNDIALHLADAAGVRKVSVRDSGNAEVAYINSDGALSAGAITGESINLTDNTQLLLVDGVIYLKNTGTNNLMLGDLTGITAVGTNNLFFGTGAGRYNATGAGSEGTYNLYLGINAGRGAVAGNTGYNNVAIGAVALELNTSGYYNVAIGREALYNNTTGHHNMSFGYDSLVYNTEGNINTAIGASALLRNTTGGQNIGIGYYSGGYNQTGSYNASIGYAAGQGATTLHNKSYSTYIGGNAGYNSQGSDMTCIGYGAGYTATTTTDCIFIGYKAGYYATANNLLIIDNQARGAGGAPTNSTLSIIYGVMAALPADQHLTFNASVDAAGTMRSTGATTPVSGAGTELLYTGGIGYVISVNRTGTVYTPLELYGTYIGLMNGNVGVGTVSFGANAVSVLGIANGTVPAAHVDNTIQIFSVDSSDAAATLGLMLEQAVEDIGTFTASHKIKVKVNGTEYWISLDQV